MHILFVYAQGWMHLDVTPQFLLFVLISNQFLTMDTSKLLQTTLKRARDVVEGSPGNALSSTTNSHAVKRREYGEVEASQTGPLLWHLNLVIVLLLADPSPLSLCLSIVTVPQICHLTLPQI